MFNYLFICTILLYLIATIFSLSFLSTLISYICLIIVIVTFFRVNKLVRLLGSVFLILGVTMLWSSDASWSDYPLSFGPMLDLLTLFTLVPILSLPIKLGGYAEGIQSLIQRYVKKSKHLYTITSSVAYFL